MYFKQDDKYHLSCCTQKNDLNIGEQIISRNKPAKLLVQFNAL